MTIDIKYTIDEQVWVMYQNKPKLTTVKTISYTVTREIDHLPSQEVISYVLGHDNSIYKQAQVYSTKEELIASL